MRDLVFDLTAQVRGPHIWVNLALLLLYPMAWAAPLMRAGWLPLFGLEEISVLTGLQSLWASDVVLAVLVTFLALVAPLFKSAGLALVHFQLLSPRLLPALSALGKLAMADVFLIALYVVIAKGIGVGRVEIAWGLYLFSGLILASVWVGWQTERAHKGPGHVSKL